MVNKQIIAVVGPLLVLTSFNSLADPGNPSIRERIVDQVLKPCEGKKAGDKVIVDGIAKVKPEQQVTAKPYQPQAAAPQAAQGAAGQAKPAAQAAAKPEQKATSNT